MDDTLLFFVVYTVYTMLSKETLYFSSSMWDKRVVNQVKKHHRMRRWTCVRGVASGWEDTNREMGGVGDVGGGKEGGGNGVRKGIWGWLVSDMGGTEFMP